LKETESNKCDGPGNLFVAKAREHYEQADLLVVLSIAQVRRKVSAYGG
jgi:hypothetical protein